MSTPIQEAIKLLESFISNRPTPNDYEHGKEVGYENAIGNLKALLPKEKEFAEKCFDAGLAYGDWVNCESARPPSPPRKGDLINQLYPEK